MCAYMYIALGALEHNHDERLDFRIIIKNCMTNAITCGKIFKTCCMHYI